MKHLSLLIWLTQLGLSVVGPLVGYILLAIWLRNRFDWGSWVVLCGVALGIFSAVDGLRQSLNYYPGNGPAGRRRTGMCCRYGGYFCHAGLF